MKIVKEHINEVINFERKQDKMSSLGVGQIHLIKSWLDEMEITNYVINDDLTIDVHYSVDLSYKNLNKFPDFIKFNKVGGGFSCSDNNLTSLEGCPTSVGRGFFCDNNNLTSLEGCPTLVGGDFFCSDNNLISLEGCSTSVGGNFSCRNNNLTSLEGCPTSVGEDFYCRDNKRKFTIDEVRKFCKVKGNIYVKNLKL